MDQPLTPGRHDEDREAPEGVQLQRMAAEVGEFP